MNDRQLDALIAESLKSEEDFFPEPEEEHRFSGRFRKKMKYLLYEQEYPPPDRKFRVRRWWFALAAAMLAVSVCSLTVYGSRTNQIHFFADKFLEYQPLDTMEEDTPSYAKLAYDLDALAAKYETGVEIVSGEQYTRFFRNPETGEFFEFSSYPKISFRWHAAAENPETIVVGDKEITYFTDRSQIHYALWSASATVFVIRSDMSREQMLAEIASVRIYEIV